MRAGKIVLAIVMVLLVMGAGAGVIWYFSVPHSAAEQFAYAEKLEKKMQGDVVTKGAKAMAGDIEKVIQEYLKVGSQYGKSDKAAEALKRVAEIQEKVVGDDAKAMATLDQLIKDYPGLDNEGFALIEQARLLRKAAEDLRVGKPGDAADKYKAAIAKLEEYRKKFDKEPKAKLDDALMEIGRIWQDGLGEPLIRAIDVFEKELKDYPESENRAEALYRLGRQYLAAKEEDKAYDLFGKVVDEYPKSDWAAKALNDRAEILAKKQDKHDEAAKDYERLAREHPETPEGQAASGRARSEEGKSGEEEGKKYSEGRYGGKVPFDTVGDKPIPPAGMFRQFAEQKLDAQHYDLDVDFLPDDNRITVKGTLSVVNGGTTKKEMLLMLGAPLNVSTLTVDGKAAKFTHDGETLTIDLAGEWKTGAAATVGFEYTGQYAPPLPTMEDLKAAMGPRTVKGLTPSTAPATGPATAPAAAAKKGMKYAYNPQMGLGEFGYGLSGAAWYPITIIGDVFDAHVVIRTPEGVEAVSNGEVVRREKSTKAGVKGVFEFTTKQPVFGLYFAYGPYTVQETQLGTIHFYSYFREANSSKHQAYIDVMNKILSFYGSKFGTFPYEKMAVVEVPLPPFLGGVGPASLMFLHESLIVHAGVPEYLLAHELAHQWFGNEVPINMMDERYNQWLSEGFATYCDALYTEHSDGPKALAAHMEKYGQFFFQFNLLAGRGEGAIKTTYPNSAMYRPVIYEKGAIVLHMLRKVIGDEKFFNLLRQYVDTYKNKPTTMDDFRRMASKEYGQDLSWFFAEWIDLTVFAHWKIKAEVTGGEKPGETVKVTLVITQPDDLVKMPADITLIGAGGERQVLPNVMLDKIEQTVDAAPAFRPVKVIIDEDYWVLRHPGSDNIWTAPVAAAPAAPVPAK